MKAFKIFVVSCASGVLTTLVFVAELVALASCLFSLDSLLTVVDWEPPLDDGGAPGSGLFFVLLCGGLIFCICSAAILNFALIAALIHKKTRLLNIFEIHSLQTIQRSFLGFICGATMGFLFSVVKLISDSENHQIPLHSFPPDELVGYEGIILCTSAIGFTCGLIVATAKVIAEFKAMDSV